MSPYACLFISYVYPNAVAHYTHMHTDIHIGKEIPVVNHY